MKLNVNDIEDSPRELSFSEPTEALNAELVHGGVQDFEFQSGADVSLSYHRSGDDLVFTGRVAGQVIGHCARCLEPYPFELSSDLALIMIPKQQQADDEELGDEDAHLSYYQGEEVDLS